jgi:2-(1,2-epoxy-1,2-dihydrophenyl)acetyl-CoA isomerase
MQMKHVRMERDDGVGTITLDRPERFNSLDVATAMDLRKAGLRLARDVSVRVIVLRGRPEVFCSGADLKYVDEGGDARELAYLRPAACPVDESYGERFKQILEYLHSTISELRRAPKPVLAAVDGVAAAGGFGLAMACDLVVASERACFEWAYSKTGLTGAESSTFLLPRLLGLRRALELVLLNPRLDARAAHGAGLLSAVHPVEAFDAEVELLARRLADGPTPSYGVAKALMNRAVGMEGLDAHLDRELEGLVASADGPEFAEGLDAFLNRRPHAFPREASGGGD